ncbi:hypothetical protein [Marinibactrum halimedae]|uniref:hypothetical protein n=1 Tax=Marinibactrum halimedae TaxID=1444977 RepID=UPI001E3D5346|nr:hypothetical protein [Marinibactrum halimedae]MCD9458127.1 hypothetical protein [Marinibactrum halimedae]
MSMRRELISLKRSFVGRLIASTCIVVSMQAHQVFASDKSVGINASLAFDDDGTGRGNNGHHIQLAHGDHYHRDHYHSHKKYKKRHKKLLRKRHNRRWHYHGHGYDRYRCYEDHYSEEICYKHRHNGSKHRHCETYSPRYGAFIHFGV